MRFFTLMFLSCFFAGSLSAQYPHSSEETFQVVEIMPSFPYTQEDCPDGDRRTCGFEAVKVYLQENIYYPAEALAQGVEGMAVISFVVEKDGQLVETKIVRNPGAGTGEEALRVVEQMNEVNQRWLPGTQRGHAVRVQYNLPVKFQIGYTKGSLAPKQDSVYKVVDILPLFPGSQSGCGETPKKCSLDKMLTYVYKNVGYPNEAVSQGVYGMSVVKFIVEKNGTMSDLKVVRDPGAGTGDEALRVVQSIADKNMLWTPGQIDGKPVRTSFALPIKFSLSKKQIKDAKKRAKRANKN
jgi:TonB family protein